MASTLYQIFVRYIGGNGKPLTNKTQVEWISAEELTELKKFWEECASSNEVRQYMQCISTLMPDLSIVTGQEGSSIYKENYYKLSINLLVDEKNLTPAQLATYQKCLKYMDINNKLYITKDNSVTEEYCYIRSYDDLFMDIQGDYRRAAKKLDKVKYQIVIDESSADNPKYDMIFMYNGIANAVFPGYGNDPNKTMLNEYPGVTNNNPFIAPEIYYEKMKRIKLDPWFFHSQYASLSAAMHKAEELVGFLGKDAVKIGKVVPLDQYIEIV